MTDYRALCAELENAYTWCIEKYMTAPAEKDTLIQRARAALAQPEPVAPTDEELIEPIMWMIDERVYDTDGKGEIAESLRELIARWGTPTAQPVPVSERWPQFSDCNPFEEVWAFNPVLAYWKLTRINRSIHTHWLPHWALPVPTPANNTREENLDD